MPSEYTVMIVDDEQDAVELLSTHIKENCPSLKIVAAANRSEDAIKLWYKIQPDLIFLDIEVDQMNGFDIINEISSERNPPHFIFVTGYNRYAVDAFQTNALGYLLKPVIKGDLVKAVERFIHMKESEQGQERLWEFIRDYTGKIRFNTNTGFSLIHPPEILWCEADHNYTKIYMTDGKPVLVSVNLAVVEEKLPGTGFQRISRSILINSRYLASVHRRHKTCTLKWSGGEKILNASADMIKKM
jgi:two-component system, LytTR family, response regulator